MTEKFRSLFYKDLAAENLRLTQEVERLREALAEAVEDDDADPEVILFARHLLAVISAKRRPEMEELHRAGEETGDY